jgi:hypothetical protein
VAHSFDLLRAFYAAILHYLEKRLAGGTTTGLRVMHFVLSSPVLQKSPTYSSPTKHARSRRDFTGFRKKERTSAVGIVAEITLNEELKVWPLRCNYPVEKGACSADRTNNRTSRRTIAASCDRRGLKEFRKWARNTMWKLKRVEEGGRIVLRILGRLESKWLSELEDVLASETTIQNLTLDLADVKLVDRDTVRFLANCESSGVALRGCPSYICEWIAAEKKRRRQAQRLRQV